ncbi:lipopolysaccharide biosynthesis protein [Butyricimonas faecihominis]|uniref:lipopolysaccharide biosynthesis protein n=1 Tax=Butyricimonas faecihominis TaxID=1472416 RepID=UPI0032C12B6E
MRIRQKISVSTAVKYSGGVEIYRLSTGFLLNFLLAYLFTKEDFGLIAILLVIGEIFFSISNMGMGEALIQRSYLNRRYLNAAFWGNFIIAFVGFFILIFCAPYISAFFNSEKMTWPLRGYACIFLIRILGIVPNAWCEKNFRFDIIAKLSFVAISLRLVIVLFCAWKELGIRSIVIGDLIYHITISLGIYLFINFRPRLKYFDLKSFWELFQFGNKLLVANLFSIVSQKADVFVIGKFVSTIKLGVYSFAYMLTITIPSLVNNIVQKVFFPRFSLIKDDKKILCKEYLKITEFIAYISLPVSVGIWCVVDIFLVTFYGNKWDEAVYLIKILCFYSITNSLGGVLWGQVLKALGMSSLVMKMTFLQVIALVLTVSIGVVCNGIIGVAYAMVVYGVVFRLVYQAIINRKIFMNMFDYLKTIYLPIICNIILFLLLQLEKSVIYANVSVLWIQFTLLLFLGFVDYILILFLFNKKILNMIRVLLK